MNDDERIERLLRARPMTDTAYQPVIADLLDTPRDGEPVVGSLRWRPGSPVILRPVALLLLAAAILLSMVVMFVGGRQDKLVTVHEPSPPPTTVTAGAAPNFPATEVTALLERFKTNRWGDASKVVIDVAIVEDERIWFAASGPSWFTTQTGGHYPGQTVVRVGGLTRLYLLAITLRLVDEGRLTLDTPISRYISSWPGGASITIRNLLDGSSGVPSFGEPVEDLTHLVAAEPARAWTSADALRLARDRSPRFAPGTRHATVDTEDVLLVSIIETVTGSRVHEIVFGLGLEFYPRPAGGVHLGPPESRWPPTVAGLWDPADSGRFAEVADLPADVLAVLGPARDWAVHVAGVAQATDDLHTHPSLLSAQARAMVGKPFEEGGFGGLRMCPCDGGARTGVGFTGHMGPYTSFVVHVPSDRLTIALVANVAIADDHLEGLLQDLHDLVGPAIH